MKGNGMVRDVLDPSAIGNLVGSMGIGHGKLRRDVAKSFRAYRKKFPEAYRGHKLTLKLSYSALPYRWFVAGFRSSTLLRKQPLWHRSWPCKQYTETQEDCANLTLLCPQNGNLINTPHLRYYLDHYAHRHINTDSDSELLLNILADNLQKTGKFRIDEEDIFRAIGELMRHCHGAYAVTAMLAGFGIIAFRDPHGIRPLGYGRRLNANGSDYDYVIASESVVSDALGFSHWVDVKPGEAIIITRESIQVKQVVPKRSISPDIFEYVYFARPDSVLDGISVYSSRMAMGEALAGEVQRQLKAENLTCDVVIPVPDTSRVAALQAAQTMGVPYREGFCKNRYVGRTFIMPGQSMRRKNVRRKLNAMSQEFSGKTVVLVDDSIVRGTTSKEIIQMARDAGAAKVIMASCAPPIRYSNVYGIDMPSRHELVAHGRTEKEIAEYIGADLVVFQKLEDLVESCRQFNPEIESFDCSVFTGKYVTGGVDEKYLQHIQDLREDNAKLRKAADPHGMVNGSAGSPPKIAKHPNGDQEDSAMTCSGPMNGADAIGLYNEPGLRRKNSTSRPGDTASHNSAIGLSNSFYSGLASMDVNDTGVSEGANAVAGGAGAPMR